MRLNVVQMASVLALMACVGAGCGWGPAEKDRANGETNSGDGQPLSINGVQYQKGLGVHAPSEIRYALNGAYGWFQAEIGVDDYSTVAGSVVFQVYLME